MTLPLALAELELIDEYEFDEVHTYVRFVGEVVPFRGNAGPQFAASNYLRLPLGKDAAMFRTPCTTSAVGILFASTVLASCGPSAPPTASKVTQVSITLVQLNNTNGTPNPNAPDSDDIPYGRSATVGIWAQLDEVAGPNGFAVTLELWENDGPDVADDQLSTGVTLTVRSNLKTTRTTVTLSCNDKGELSGTAGTDTDDGSDGALRVYEVYGYDKAFGNGSPDRAINCVPPAEDGG